MNNEPDELEGNDEKRRRAERLRSVEEMGLYGGSDLRGVCGGNDL